MPYCPQQKPQHLSQTAYDLISFVLLWIATYSLVHQLFSNGDGPVFIQEAWHLTPHRREWPLFKWPALKWLGLCFIAYLSLFGTCNCHCSKEAHNPYYIGEVAISKLPHICSTLSQITLRYSLSFIPQAIQFPQLTFQPLFRCQLCCTAFPETA